MHHRFTQKLFLTVLCALQIATNAFGMEMESEQLKLLPEIQGKIITNILDLYLNELEGVEECYTKEIWPYWKEDRGPLYQKNTQELIKKVMDWLERTHFVQEHIDINTISKKGNTLLYHVIKNASDKEKSQLSDICIFTQYLLKYNANPNIQNNDGKTAFWHCMWNCLERFHCKDWYSDSQREMFKNLIRLFLTHNADPNVSSSDGGLCLLADREYSDMVTEILKHSDIKAFANSKDKDGYTPAIYAATMINIDFLHILANAGADFTIKDNHNETPLDCALACKGNYIMELVRGTERIYAVIKFLQNTIDKSNQ